MLKLNDNKKTEIKLAKVMNELMELYRRMTVETVSWSEGEHSPVDDVYDCARYVRDRAEDINSIATEVAKMADYFAGNKEQ